MTQIKKWMGRRHRAEVLICVDLRKSVASFAAIDYNLGPCALTDEISCGLLPVSPARP
jgi:hypothetical protein